LHWRTNKHCKNPTQESLKMKLKCQLLNHKHPENETEVLTDGPQGILYSQVMSGRDNQSRGQNQCQLFYVRKILYQNYR
jgi:hypothetical protein